MSMIPAAPRDEHGALATNRYHVLDNLRDGVLGSCCACGHTCGTWWRDDQDNYTALHERCADKLIETWQAMIEEGIGEAPVNRRLAGAYARRAAARARPAGARGATSAQAIEPTKRSIDRGSPFFRPGMPDGAPWVTWGQTAIDRPLAPSGLNEQAARRTCAQWQAAYRIGAVAPGRSLVIGAVVIGPDGALSDAWGRYPKPGEPEPWPSLVQARDWFACLECAARRWPGCWRLLDGTCVSCARERESLGRPSWPDDPLAFSVDPLTAPRKARREKATTLA